MQDVVGVIFDHVIVDGISSRTALRPCLDINVDHAGTPAN
jgi:hypothetical protein